MGNRVITPTNEQTQQVNMREYYEKEIVAKRHNCTDVICLLLFIIFIVAQVILSIIIYVIGGDPSNILLPHDNSGNLCTGSSPYLFYFDIAQCASPSVLVSGCTTPTKCVAACPTSNYYYVIPSQLSALFPQLCQQSQLSAFFAGNVPASTNQATYSQLVAQQICPAYVLSSTSVYYRCLPSFLTSAMNTAAAVVATDSTNGNAYNISSSSGVPLTNGLVSSATSYLVQLLNVKGTAQFIFEDFVNSVVLIGVLLGIAAVVSFIYIIVMRWILAPFIYLSLVALVGLLAFGLYFCVTKYLSLLGNSDTSQQSFYLSTNFSYYGSLSTTWLIASIVVGVLLLIVLLLVIFLMRRLRLAIQLICEASKAISSVFSTLLFPLIPMLLQLGFLAYFLANAVILACSGKSIFKVANSTNSSLVGSNCDPSATSATGVQCLFYKYGFDSNSVYNSAIGFLNNYQFVPQLYNLFMLFWVQAFIVGLNQMILAGSFGIWYWSKNSAHLILFTSVKDTLVYHLGSIAFGSLLIAIVKILRTIIQMVERRIKAASGNNAQLSCCITFLSCCCRCCLWCLEKVLKFINRNAYIMVAIYGKNFCLSAKDALSLLLANPLRALVLDRVTDFCLFIGRLLVTSGVGVLGFYFFSRSFYIDPNFRKYFAPELHYYWVPLIAVIVGAYFITKTFFTVFEMAVDTIFLCAMKDLELHDGSPEKPYYMSTKLLKILNVKNKEALVPKQQDDVKPGKQGMDFNNLQQQ